MSLARLPSMSSSTPICTGCCFVRARISAIASRVDSFLEHSALRGGPLAYPFLGAWFGRAAAAPRLRLGHKVADPLFYLRACNKHMLVPTLCLQIAMLSKYVVMCIVFVRCYDVFYYAANECVGCVAYGVACAFSLISDMFI